MTKVGRQLIAHRFTSMIDGVAIWSFVPRTRTKTRVEVAAGNRAEAAGRGRTAAASRTAGKLFRDTRPLGPEAYYTHG